jgi:hypothetical protein
MCWLCQCRFRMATWACIGALIAKFSPASAEEDLSTGRNRQHNCFPSALIVPDTMGTLSDCRTYLDRKTAPTPRAADGIFLARIDLKTMSSGPPVPLFDPTACRTTSCLLHTGVATSGTIDHAAAVKAHHTKPHGRHSEI